MKTYEEIKIEASDKSTKLFDKYRAFFAFSESQLQEAMTKHGIKDRSELVSMQAGLIAPRVNAKLINDGLVKIRNEQVREIREQVNHRKVILYELNNYECFYQGDIKDAMPTLSALGFTREQVLEVFKHPKSRRAK